MGTARTFRTLADGRVEVDGGLPGVAAGELAVFRSRMLGTHRARIDANAARTGLPAAWIAGHIWQESRGEPGIIAPDGGVGLMMLTHSGIKAGHSDQELTDPDLNVRIGSDVLAQIRKSNPELPAVASCYNAGAGAGGKPHPSTVSPWGYRETTGHIDGVIRGANTWITEAGAGVAPGSSTSGGGAVAALAIGLVGLALFSDW